MDFEAGRRDVAQWYADVEGSTQSNYATVMCAAYARLAALNGPEIAGQGAAPGA